MVSFPILLSFSFFCFISPPYLSSSCFQDTYLFLISMLCVEMVVFKTVMMLKWKRRETNIENGFNSNDLIGEYTNFLKVLPSPCLSCAPTKLQVCTPYPSCVRLL